MTEQQRKFDRASKRPMSPKSYYRNYIFHPDEPEIVPASTKNSALNIGLRFKNRRQLRRILRKHLASRITP